MSHLLNLSNFSYVYYAKFCFIYDFSDQAFDIEGTFIVRITTSVSLKLKKKVFVCHKIVKIENDTKLSKRIRIFKNNNITLK